MKIKIKGNIDLANTKMEIKYYDEDNNILSSIIVKEHSLSIEIKSIQDRGFYIISILKLKGEN